MNYKEIFSGERGKIFAILWITYSAFYLTRVNYSICLPMIQKEANLTYTEVGAIASALFGAYAVGQFVNGQLADNFGQKQVMFIGITVSALANIIFGFSSAFWIFLIIWAINGYFQACGWPSSVRILANWYPKDVRGRVTGAYGTCYQVGNVYAWVLTGLLVGSLGWRYGFWVNAIIFFAWGLFFVAVMKNRPREAESLPKEKKSSLTGGLHACSGLRYTLKATSLNWKVWVVALAFLLLDITRYGLTTYVPAYFYIQGIPIGKAAITAGLIPLFGSIGAITLGYVTDKYFHGRRSPVIILALTILGIALMAFLYVPTREIVVLVLFLIVIGYTLYGAHVLMVTTMPIDLAGEEATASATGFIDGFGYIGAFLGTLVSGVLMDTYKSFIPAFWFWGVAAVVGSLLMLAVRRY